MVDDQDPTETDDTPPTDGNDESSDAWATESDADDSADEQAPLSRDGFPEGKQVSVTTAEGEVLYGLEEHRATYEAMGLKVETLHNTDSPFGTITGSADPAYIEAGKQEAAAAKARLKRGL